MTKEECITHWRSLMERHTESALSAAALSREHDINIHQCRLPFALSSERSATGEESLAGADRRQLIMRLKGVVPKKVYKGYILEK